MRTALFAAILLLPAIPGVAFAGNEQPYEGNALPVTSAPALTETNTAAEFQPGPAIVLSLSRVATNETGNERPAVFDGQLASTGETALAGK